MSEHTHWKKFVSLAIIVGFIASLITISQIVPWKSQSIQGTSSSLVTSGVPINPDLRIQVIPQYGWKIFTNGSLPLALVPNNEPVIFSFVFENQGSSPLDVLCCSVNIRFLPSSLHGDILLSGGTETKVAAHMNATASWTYLTDFARFQGYRAQITFVFYSADGSWQNPKVVLIYFSS